MSGHHGGTDKKDNAKWRFCLRLAGIDEIGGSNATLCRSTLARQHDLIVRDKTLYFQLVTKIRAA